LAALTKATPLVSGRGAETLLLNANDRLYPLAMVEWLKLHVPVVVIDES
jgi:hypothetical protein